MQIRTELPPELGEDLLGEGPPEHYRMNDGIGFRGHGREAVGEFRNLVGGHVMEKHGDRAVLAALVTNPDRVSDLSLAALPSLIGEAEALRARLLAQLVAAAAIVPGPPPKEGAGIPDRLLTAAQAADRLNVNVRWIYQRAKSLPFTRRLSPGTLRFSEKGIERWKESRR